jgi:hypothetical protein
MCNSNGVSYWISVYMDKLKETQEVIPTIGAVAQCFGGITFSS